MNKRQIILGFLIQLGYSFDFTNTQGPVIHLTVNNDLAESIKTENIEESDIKNIDAFIKGAINGKFALIRCNIVPSTNDGSKFVEMVQIIGGASGTVDFTLFTDVIPALDGIINLRAYIAGMTDNKFKDQVIKYLDAMNHEGTDEDITSKWIELEKVIVDKAVLNHKELIDSIKKGTNPQDILININTLMSRIGLYVYDQLAKRKDSAVIKAYHKTLKALSE